MGKWKFVIDEIQGWRLEMERRAFGLFTIQEIDLREKLSVSSQTLQTVR